MRRSSGSRFLCSLAGRANEARGGVTTDKAPTLTRAPCSQVLLCIRLITEFAPIAFGRFTRLRRDVSPTPYPNVGPER